MIDKASVIKEAQKYLAKGQIDKAIAEWEKLAAASPEGNVFNFIGDLYLKKGDKPSAIGAYHKAAEIFRREGFTLKALALYKKILNLNASDANALYALGELNEEKSIATDAIKYYLAAADIFSKENKRAEILRAFGKIVQLAPTNIPMRVKVSEMFSKEGLVAEAAREYIAVGRLYEAQGELKWAGEYFKKAMEIQPNNRGAFVAMSELFEKAGDLKQALHYVRVAAERTGEDAELKLRQARLLIESGDIEGALGYLTKTLNSDPSNAELRNLMGGLYMKTGETEKAVKVYLSLADDLISAMKYDDAMNILNSIKVIEPVEARKKLVFLFRQNGDEKSAFDEIAGLAGVYEERDMPQEALERLKEAEGLQPDNYEIKYRIEALERKLSGEEAPQAPQAPQPSPQAPAPFESTLESVPDIEAMLPPETERPEKETQASGIDTESPFGDEDEEGPVGAVLEEAPASGEKTVGESLTEVDIFLRYGLHEDAKNLLESLKVREPRNIEVHQKLKSLYIDQNDVEQAVTECLILSEISRRSGDEDGKTAFLKEAFELDPSDPRLAGRMEPAQPVQPAQPARREPKEAAPPPEPAALSIPKAIPVAIPEAATEEPASLDDELAEAEFYVKQGFLGEARGIYLRLLGKFPGDPGLKEKLRDCEERMKAPAPFDEQSGAASTQEGEDLALPDVSTTEAQEIKEPALETGVLEIFEEFKRGLEKQIEAEDSETHYNLGIAYKEMGLLDDAINSFQMAQHDPKLYVQTTSMLGLCYMEKGIYSLAADAFSSALMKTDAEEESAWGLKYELAAAYEKGGNPKEALKLFTEVYGWNAKFREVAEKVTELKKHAEAAQLQEKQGKVKKSRVSYI